MKYNNQIKKFCEDKTDLNEADIDYLIRQSEAVLSSKEFMDKDVFIDVKNIYSDHAIVVFHRKPHTKESLYEKTVVGQSAFLENEPGVLRTLQTGVPSVGLRGQSQEGVAIEQTVFPIVRGEKVIATLIVESDFSNSFSSSFSLQQSKGDHSYIFQAPKESVREDEVSLLDYVEDAVLVFDQGGFLLHCNQSAVLLYRSKLGYLESIQGMHYDNLSLDGTVFSELIGDHFSDRNKAIKYGKHYFQVKCYPNARNHQTILTIRDVTELQSKEKEIQENLIASREINHRVKNHLQTIISLLRLQGAQVKDSGTKVAFEDCINRIFSIAATYELLSNQEHEKISLKPLIEIVSSNIQRCFAERTDVQLRLNVCEDIYLDHNRASSLALVVNELLQNSYEHAFVSKKHKKNQKNQCIRLQITKNDDIIRIQVIDNGSGYNVETVGQEHLGLILVQRFVESKLSGRLVINSNHEGTQVKIIFKM